MSETEASKSESHTSLWCRIFGHVRASGWAPIERLIKGHVRNDLIAICKRCDAQYSSAEDRWTE